VGRWHHVIAPAATGPPRGPLGLANALAVTGVTERVKLATPAYAYRDHEPIRYDDPTVIGHQLDRPVDEYRSTGDHSDSSPVLLITTVG
jgi:hypothetical protein